MKNIFNKINAVTLVIAILTFIVGWRLGQQNFQVQLSGLTPKVNFENQEIPKV